MLLRVGICRIDDHAFNNRIIFTLASVATLACGKQILPNYDKMRMWTFGQKVFYFHVIGRS